MINREYTSDQTQPHFTNINNFCFVSATRQEQRVYKFSSTYLYLTGKTIGKTFEFLTMSINFGESRKCFFMHSQALKKLVVGNCANIIFQQQFDHTSIVMACIFHCFNQDSTVKNWTVAQDKIHYSMMMYYYTSQITPYS